MEYACIWTSAKPNITQLAIVQYICQHSTKVIVFKLAVQLYT